uniref:Uncharacterized protein n=1 Tax=Steinernema glaseri TaxID=37863 RepID=A0A1I8AEM6_9BILA
MLAESTVRMPHEN